MGRNMTKTISFDARELMKEYTILHVRLTNLWKVKLGLYFIKIGCWISGVGIEVEED